MNGREYIWYACYGSNLNKHRFLCYLKGGQCKYNNRTYEGCTDKSDPIADRPIIMPHSLYFGNESGSWEYSGVAFINPQVDKTQRTLGRMYLITAEQFAEIHVQEGDSSNWYNQIIDLGENMGYRIKTFTNSRVRPLNAPSPKYCKVISDGLQEIYPDMGYEEINQYLARCINAYDSMAV